MNHPMVSQHRSAPTLETERLLIRGYTRDDLDGHLAIVGDDATMTFIGGKGLSREDTWRRLAATVGMWQLMGFGGWAVVRKQDKRIIGTISVFTAWRDLEPEFGDQPEMGWIFAPDVHGQGYASEACEAVLGWVDDTLQPTPLWAIISPENAPSLKLAERLGFERHNLTTYHDDPTVVLKRPVKG